MLTARKLVTNINFFNFHTSSVRETQAKIMKKLMAGNSSKKKHKYVDSPILSNPQMFSKGSHEGKQSVNSKRASVLNKLFMRCITDLMMTGSCSSEFVGRGIEINRVLVTPDFNGVRVYWIAKGTDNDEIIENILNKNVSALRHELSQLKVIGVVPKIQFLKDKHYARIVEVERLLAKADFGDDYVQVSATDKLTTELKLNTTLDKRIKEEILSLDAVTDLETSEALLPPMTHNVFDLNHYDMMERVAKSVKKSQGLFRVNSEVQESVGVKQIQEENLAADLPKQQREKLQNFIRNRQLMKSKANKESKHAISGMDYLQEEQQRDLDAYGYIHDLNEEEDFIDEDET